MFTDHLVDGLDHLLVLFFEFFNGVSVRTHSIDSEEVDIGLIERDVFAFLLGFFVFVVYLL